MFAGVTPKESLTKAKRTTACKFIAFSASGSHCWFGRRRPRGCDGGSAVIHQLKTAPQVASQLADHLEALARGGSCGALLETHRVHRHNQTVSSGYDRPCVNIDILSSANP
jgi:hypothetical protein